MLPEKWIDRIFDHLLAMYGSKFSDIWKTADISAVRRMWAEKLGGFQDHPEAIKQALDSMDERPFPPTLPEFLHACRDAARRIGSHTLALPHHQTAEEREAADKAAKAIKEAAHQMGNRDPLAWAKKPRSNIALQSVIALASKGDDRFKAILATLITDGITDGQRLLYAWNGKDWEQPQ